MIQWFPVQALHFLAEVFQGNASQRFRQPSMDATPDGNGNLLRVAAGGEVVARRLSKPRLNSLPVTLLAIKNAHNFCHGDLMRKTG